MNVNAGKVLFFCPVLAALLFFPQGCGGTKKEDAPKPPALTMDLPKVDSDSNKPKPDAPVKKAPEIKKSNIEFKVNEREIKKRIAENPAKDEASCLKLVESLQKRKDAIQRDEGIWGRIEQIGELKAYSTVGVKLDSQINQMTHMFRRLCETAKGVPYNDLAKFINEEIGKNGEKKLREKLDDMGEVPADVEAYLKYGAFAKTLKDRVVDYASIQESIYRSEVYMDKYEEFAKRLTDKKSLETAIPDVMALYDALVDFMSADKIMAMGMMEESQIPASNFRPLAGSGI